MEEKRVDFISKMKDRVIKVSKLKFCPVTNATCRTDCVCWRLGADLKEDVVQIWVDCAHKSIENVVYRETVKFTREANENE